MSAELAGVVDTSHQSLPAFPTTASTPVVSVTDLEWAFAQIADDLDDADAPNESARHLLQWVMKNYLAFVDRAIAELGTGQD